VICATACRGLRASVEEEPTAGTRWRGGVGESAGAPPPLPGRMPVTGGGEVRRPREQRSRGSGRGARGGGGGRSQEGERKVGPAVGMKERNKG
jgi:hypothetical protein